MIMMLNRLGHVTRPPTYPLWPKRGKRGSGQSARRCLRRDFLFGLVAWLGGLFGSMYGAGGCVDGVGLRMGMVRKSWGEIGGFEGMTAGDFRVCEL